MKFTTRTVALAITAITALVAAPPAHAGLYFVRLEHLSGPSLTGVVDAATDTFRIDTWTNAPGSGYRTPRANQLPLTLSAFTLAGAPFDVPEVWDGTIGSAAGWAFLLPVGFGVDDLIWEEGQPSGAFRNSSFGWGGFRNAFGQNFLRGGTSTLAYLPFGSGARDALVSTVSIQPIPEPAGALFGVAVLAVCLTRRRAFQARTRTRLAKVALLAVIAFPVSLGASPPDRRIAWLSIEHFDVRDLDFPSALHHLLRKAEVASGEQLAFKPVYHTSEAALPSVTLQIERMPFTAVLGYLCDQAGVRATIEGTRVTLTRKQPAPPPSPLDDPEVNPRSPVARSEPNFLQKAPEAVGGYNVYRNTSGEIMWKKTGRILHRAASGFSIVDDPTNTAPVDCPHAPICKGVCVGARTAKSPTSPAAGSGERAVAAQAPAATLYYKEWKVDPAWMGALIGTDQKGGAKAALERQGVTFPPGSIARWVPVSQKLIVYTTARTLDVIDQIVPTRR